MNADVQQTNGRRKDRIAKEGYGGRHTQAANIISALRNHFGS